MARRTLIAVGDDRQARGARRLGAREEKQNAQKSLPHTRRSIVFAGGFKVEFVTRPARALDFNFHGWLDCAKLNGVWETFCWRIALLLSQSGAKYKRIDVHDHLVLAALKLSGLN